MRTSNMSLTSENQKHIDVKCAAFNKRFSDAIRLSLEIRHDRHHRKGDVITMRASVSSMRKGESTIVHGESTEETFIRALDEVLDVLGKQLERATTQARIRSKE